MRDLRVIARKREVWNPGVDLYAFVLRTDESVDLAEPLTMKRHLDGDIQSPPTLSLQPEQAQALMDSLWDAGLRPSEGSGSAGALAATQTHLQDMRRLVFERKP